MSVESAITEGVAKSFTCIETTKIKRSKRGASAEHK